MTKVCIPKNTLFTLKSITVNFSLNSFLVLFLSDKLMYINDEITYISHITSHEDSSKKQKL